jgi:hypothetical protein
MKKDPTDVAAHGHVARAFAMVSAIERLSLSVEEVCGDDAATFELITAVQACAQVARLEFAEAGYA